MCDLGILQVSSTKVTAYLIVGLETSINSAYIGQSIYGKMTFNSYYAFHFYVNISTCKFLCQSLSSQSPALRQLRSKYHYYLVFVIKHCGFGGVLICLVLFSQ